MRENEVNREIQSKKQNQLKKTNKHMIEAQTETIRQKKRDGETADETNNLTQLPLMRRLNHHVSKERQCLSRVSEWRVKGAISRHTENAT